MPAQTIVLTLFLLLVGGLFQMVPRLTRPDLFFAVTVAPEFRRTSGAHRITRRYHAIVWSSTLVAIAVVLATGIVPAAVLIQVGGFLWALASGHRRALAYAASPSPIIEVDLAAPREGLPGGPIVAVLPVLSLGVLGLWAALYWHRLPQRFPVHWGMRGADRWVTTTPATLFGFLAFHALVCLLVIGMAWGLLHWSRRISTSGAAAAAERHFRRRIAQLLVVTGYFLACPAWFTLFQPAAAAISVWGLALAVVTAAFTVSLIRGGQGGSRAIAATAAAPAGDRTPDACWKWGIFYVNPADPSILVEERFGLGYTLNLGNPWTWVVVALLLAPLPVALIFLR